MDFPCSFSASTSFEHSLLILGLGIRALSNSCVLAIPRRGDPVCTVGDADLRVSEPESLEEN